LLQSRALARANDKRGRGCRFAETLASAKRFLTDRRIGRLIKEAEMNRLMIALPFAAALMAAVATPALSHHAFVMFSKDMEKTLRGTVKEFMNTNPHAEITVTTADGDWLIQTESPLVLEKAGIDDSTLMKGEMVTVRVHPMKDGRKIASLIDLETQDGMVMSLGDKAYGELMENAAKEEAKAAAKTPSKNTTGK
jgi:hypothetical protein